MPLKNMLIDTHTHLYDDASIEEQDAHIQRALAAGVHKLYMPNCDSSTIEPMWQIAQRFPEHCFPMMGLHPCYVKEHYQAELDIIAAQLQQRKFSAIGEIGLDFYWDKTYAAEQQIVFEQQIAWAIDYHLPIVIHSRSSTQACIDTVLAQRNKSLIAIFHCFSGTVEQASQIADMGCYIGIGGVVTYKKSELPDLLQQVPLSAIVLETDAPYLAPTPFRGKRNESTYLPYIAEKLAEIYQMPLAEIARMTTENAQKIFR
jgi:TatD DNase family protein